MWWGCRQAGYLAVVPCRPQSIVVATPLRHLARTHLVWVRHGSTWSRAVMCAMKMYVPHRRPIARGPFCTQPLVCIFDGGRDALISTFRYREDALAFYCLGHGIAIFVITDMPNTCEATRPLSDRHWQTGQLLFADLYACLSGWQVWASRQLRVRFQASRSASAHMAWTCLKPPKRKVWTACLSNDADRRWTRSLAGYADYSMPGHGLGCASGRR